MKTCFSFMIALITLFISCNKNTARRILIENSYAEGNISEDSILNGLIKFYDTTSGIKQLEANYVNGVLNGKSIEYYQNGREKTTSNYVNGKINGLVLHFDSLGKIDVTQNYYYDLQVGPHIEYKNGKLIKYHFLSLENKLLFETSYDNQDSNSYKIINDSSYFFWNTYNYITSESTTPNTDLFIYLPNPPKYNFSYSLCIIDNSYKVVRIVKDFNSGLIWDTVDLNSSTKSPEEMFAIRLTINSELDKIDEDVIMFKKL